MSEGPSTAVDLSARLDALVPRHVDELVALRRDVHANPELGRAEVRTTRVIRQHLLRAGLVPRVLPSGTGLLCDIGDLGDIGDPVQTGETSTGADDVLPGPTVALRADIDALPIADEKDVSYRSTVPGVCHACGHDAHAAMLLGAGLVLDELARTGGLPPGRVRLIFQPAEELTPGGSLDVMAAGGLDGVERIFGLHCDPRTDVGRVGLRTGAITSAADAIVVRLSGPGGHTARPHLTADVVYALAKVVTELPAALSRRVDPRAGLSLVWGRITAGGAANAIPQAGIVEGTIRCLDPDAWHRAPQLIEQLVTSVTSAYGVTAQLDYRRGVPPVVNDRDAVRLLDAASRVALGDDAVGWTEQSLGGEDFAWYLEKLPGALARLGVRTPGDTAARDLHQGTFDIDEAALPAGVRLFVATAVLALLET